VNHESSWMGDRAAWSNWTADECGAAVNQRRRAAWNNWRRAMSSMNRESS
jgi:hypothetical protein